MSNEASFLANHLTPSSLPDLITLIHHLDFFLVDSQGKLLFGMDWVEQLLQRYFGPNEIQSSRNVLHLYGFTCSLYIVVECKRIKNWLLLIIKEVRTR